MGSPPRPPAGRIPPMKLLLWIALFFLPLFAGAETVDLGVHGTFTISVPKGWTLSSHKEEDSGVAVTLSPAGTTNAKCLLNITYLPEPKPVPKETVDEQVETVCDQFVEESVEKKKVLRDFGMTGGAYGSYCLFTDASQVGKPIVHDVFKVIAIGIVRFKDDVFAAVSIADDDEKGPEFEAMLSAVRSASVSQGKQLP